MNLAIIGCGTMGTAHARAATSQGANIAICADKTLSRAQALARQLDARATKTLADIAAADVDAVVVASPTDEHETHVLDALKAGKKVFCEAPLAGTYKTSQKLLRAADRSKGSLFVNRSTAFDPAFESIDQQIQSNKIGTVGFVKIFRRGAAPESAGNWRTDFARSGGVVFEAMIHDFDWVTKVFGKPVRVFCHNLERSKPSKLDYAMATLTLESGMMALVIGSWAHAKDEGVTVECCGQEGMIQFASGDPALRYAPRGKTAANVRDYSASPIGTAAIDRAWQAFLEDSGQSGSAKHGVRAVRIAEAALKSARSEKAVSLGWGDGE